MPCRDGHSLLGENKVNSILSWTETLAQKGRDDWFLSKTSQGLRLPFSNRDFSSQSGFYQLSKIWGSAFVFSEGKLEENGFHCLA